MKKQSEMRVKKENKNESRTFFDTDMYVIKLNNQIFRNLLADIRRIEKCLGKQKEKEKEKKTTWKQETKMDISYNMLTRL